MMPSGREMAPSKALRAAFSSAGATKRLADKPAPAEGSGDPDMICGQVAGRAVVDGPKVRQPLPLTG